MNPAWLMSMPPAKPAGVRHVWDAERYSLIEFKGATRIARTRIDAPGKMWIYMGALWLLKDVL